MSLMVILSIREEPDLPESTILSASVYVKAGKPKVEWVDDAVRWITNPETLSLVCYGEDGKPVAEFAKNEWIGVKKYSRDEALADELVNDRRVKEILAEKLARKIKPGSIHFVK